mmetsp:Transcript_34958/g.90948  ORF Transcript_34958/g.90948 Transcript_34958/m.90948 type:complete len:225 (-) Transcript_34958:915-1589(-)
MLKSPSGSSWSAARRSHAKASRAACSSNSSPSTVPLPSPPPLPPKLDDGKSVEGRRRGEVTSKGTERIVPTQGKDPLAGEEATPFTTKVLRARNVVGTDGVPTLGVRKQTLGDSQDLTRSGTTIRETGRPSGATNVAATMDRVTSTGDGAAVHIWYGKRGDNCCGHTTRIGSANDRTSAALNVNSLENSSKEGGRNGVANGGGTTCASHGHGPAATATGEDTRN